MTAARHRIFCFWGRSGRLRPDAERRSQILTFRSRTALWILRGVLVAALMIVVGWAVFVGGDCEIGVLAPGTCKYLPAWMGDVAAFSVLAGWLACLYVAPGLILVAVVLEVLARRR